MKTIYYQIVRKVHTPPDRGFAKCPHTHFISRRSRRFSLLAKQAISFITLFQEWLIGLSIE